MDLVLNAGAFECHNAVAGTVAPIKGSDSLLQALQSASLFFLRASLI